MPATPGRNLAAHHGGALGWSLLGPPGYLIARSVVLRRNSGLGSAPLWV